MEKALDVLTDPEKNCALQSNMESRRQMRNTQTTDATQLAAAIGAALLPTALHDPAASAISNVEQGGPSGGITLQEQQPDQNQFPVSESLQEERDAKMENELANELKGDPLAHYDIDVTKEADALGEYVSLVSSVMGTPLQLPFGNFLTFTL